MKKLIGMFVIVLVCGFALADWTLQPPLTSSYTGSYIYTNVNSVAVVRLTGVECKFNASSSGTFYIDLIRNASTPVTNRIIAYAFTTATALFFGADNFDGIYLRPNDKLLFSDSVGAALTNRIYITTEGSK